MTADEKKTDCVKVHMPERLYLELSRLSVRDDRAMSEYICRVLSLHVFGHAKRGSETNEGPERA